MLPAGCRILHRHPPPGPPWAGAATRIAATPRRPAQATIDDNNVIRGHAGPVSNEQAARADATTMPGSDGELPSPRPIGRRRRGGPGFTCLRMKILLVEDEQKIADFVCSGLTARGLQVKHCDNGDAGYELAREGGYDVIVLDIMLPGRDGLSVLAGLRQAGVSTPVILLTALSEVGDRIRGLDLGADDYLAKPFFVGELAARINALARRAGDDRFNTVQVGELRLDRVARQLACRGRTAELTSREFSLLEYLMRSAGQVFTRSQILEHVWGYDFDPSTNVVDVCIKRLRDKIASVEEGVDSSSPIESVRGSGYRFRKAP
jgi:DNA-binding response OmpR family regulator